MAWGSKTSATQLTAVIDTEQFFTTTPTLTPRETHHVEIEFNPSGTTDSLDVAVYGTLDDSTENWDDSAILSFKIPPSPDPNKRSFLLAGIYKYRIGVQVDGSTDTTGTADYSYRADGVDA